MASNSLIKQTKGAEPNKRKRNDDSKVTKETTKKKKKRNQCGLLMDIYLIKRHGCTTIKKLASLSATFVVTLSYTLTLQSHQNIRVWKHEFQISTLTGHEKSTVHLQTHQMKSVLDMPTENPAAKRLFSLHEKNEKSN